MENIYKLKPITSNNFTYMFHKKEKKTLGRLYSKPHLIRKKEERMDKRIEKVIFKGLILVINKAWICAN